MNVRYIQNTNQVTDKEIDIICSPTGEMIANHLIGYYILSKSFFK